MTIVTVDVTTSAALSGLTEKVELRDARGNVIGYFMPQKIAEDEMYMEVIKSFDLVEAQRRLKEFLASGEKGYTFEEILKELEKLEKTRCTSK